MFEKSVLEKNFYIGTYRTGGVEVSQMVGYEKSYKYKSDDLGLEYRIYQPIDVQHYCLGVITNFNHIKGILEERFAQRIISKIEIDFSRGEFHE